MNQLVKANNDLTVWVDILQGPMRQAEIELGYSIPIGKLLCNPDELAQDELLAVEQFEARVLDYAFQEWEQNTERARMVMAAIAEHRARRALLWARVKNYQDIRDIASILPTPENSTGRQIAAFYNKHLQTLDEAGIEPEQVARIASQEDKKVIVVGRAIGRIERSESLPVDKTTQIQEIMDDAEILPANELARKWLNGHEQIPCDEMWIDGICLVTFICSTEDQRATLAKRTLPIRARYGNTIPILEEIRKAKK